MSITEPEFLPGQTLPAGRLQALGSAVESYTPAFTAPTPPTLGTGGSASGQWCQVGPLIIFFVTITFGSSGVNAGSGIYRIGLPPVPAALPFGLNGYGTVALQDAGGARRSGTAVESTADSTQFAIYIDDGVVQAVLPWTWAANDQIATGLCGYFFA